MTVLQLARSSSRASGRDVRRARTVKLTVLGVWGALFLNALAFYDGPKVLPIPGSVGQAVSQGALPAALVLALLVNRRRVLRPSALLAALTLLTVVALLVSLRSEFLLGSIYRSSRYVGFVLVLWLLTPWLGRHDMLLLRCHRICLSVVMATVALGYLLSPGVAFGTMGRLVGAIWPVPPTQVGHYAAVMIGTTVLLWMCRVVPGRGAALTVVIMAMMLVGSHTRTALVALVAGLVVGSASLLARHARARRAVLWSLVLGTAVVVAFANQLFTWALRGQSDTDVAELTGRTKVWTAVLNQDRPLVQDIFGSGMSNQSFDGLPIDSNWVATFQDLGLFGVLVQALILLGMLAAALVMDAGPRKALAIFLLVYCILASGTESTFVSPTPYLLELFVAASLIARPGATRARGPA